MEVFILNQLATTQQDILNISKKYILQNGIASFNIRSIAAECNISVGTIYNYFPSKTRLIVATVENVWSEIFEPLNDLISFERFDEAFRCMFETIKSGNLKYPEFFSMHSLNFASSQKKEGMLMMDTYFSQLKEKLLFVLKKDESIQRNRFTTHLTEEKFIDYVFTLLISSLLNKEDSTPLLEFIKTFIY